MNIMNEANVTGANSGPLDDFFDEVQEQLSKEVKFDVTAEDGEAQAEGYVQVTVYLNDDGRNDYLDEIDLDMDSIRGDSSYVDWVASGIQEAIDGVY